MLLPTVLFLLGLGGAAWLVGIVFSYRGIAVIGATLVLVAGSAIALTGLQVQTGAVKKISYDQINNSTVPTTEKVSYQYERVNVAAIFGVGILGSLGLGGLIMILGGVLMSQALVEDL